MEVSKLRPYIIIGIIVLVIIIFFSNATFLTIEPGHRGVLFKRFAGGLDKENIMKEGFHIVAPWNIVYKYEIRQQELSEKLDVLSSNGLSIETDVSIWYQPIADELGNLHESLGETYVGKVVIPSIRASVRNVVGRYTPEELYSTKRESVQNEIFKETSAILDEKNVQLNQVLIRSIKLPPTIKTAIESKLEQEQQSLQYEFRLEKEAKEAERRRIEAEGKAKANEIVSASLTDKILREKGIEATLQLANSNNSKVVVIGSGKDGMPLILGNN